MRIYISGSIHGQPEEGEKNFRQVADLLDNLGHQGIVPHDVRAWEHEGECPPAYSSGRDHSAACYMRGDFLAMLACDAVLMIGEWQHSVGAQREHSVACWTGIPIYYGVNALPDNRPYDDKPFKSRITTDLPNSG